MFGYQFWYPNYITALRFIYLPFLIPNCITKVGHMADSYGYKTYESEDAFFDTAVKQKVLDYFRSHPDTSLSATELSLELKIPNTSVNRALNELSELQILEGKEEGKFKRYFMAPAVRKRFDNIFKYMSEVRQFTLEQRKRMRKEKEDHSNA